MTDRVSRRDLLKGASAVAFVSAALPALAKAVPAGDPMIERLIRTMSIEQKAGQLSIYSDPLAARTEGPAVNPGLVAQDMDALKGRIARGELVGLFNGIGTTIGRELQKVAVEQSPHKIPLIFAGDVIHGMKTCFPVPLGEAASFDPSLAERTARAAAVEASAKGIHWTFAPMVDVARDQRWGRVVEGSGEDPWLGVQFARARVRGVPGCEPEGRHLHARLSQAFCGVRRGAGRNGVQHRRHPGDDVARSPSARLQGGV